MTNLLRRVMKRDCPHARYIHRDFPQPSPTYYQCLDCGRIRYPGDGEWRTQEEIARDVERLLRGDK